MQFRTILTLIGLLGFLGGFSAQAQGQATDRSPSDAVILEMREAFGKGQVGRLTELLPRAQNHVLAPWAAYWELRSRLETAEPAEISRFLSRFAGTYQEDRLRNDWLLLLGQRQEWGTFMAEYPNFRMNDDRSVQCYALLTDFNSNERDVAQQVETLWLAQRDADPGCAAAAEQQLKARKLQPHTVWLRARFGMENGNQRIAVQAVGLLDAEWANTVSAIYGNPEHYLQGKLLALRLRTKELVTLAMIRLEVKAPDLAAQEIDKLRWKTQLSQEERSWVWGVIGKSAAMRQSDKALAYFLKGQDKLMQADHLAWKVRAALRVGRWEQVAKATEAMNESQRQEAVWVYWRARALLLLAKTPVDHVDAQRLLQSVAGVKGFYELLAQEELGLEVTPPPRPDPRPEAEKAAASGNPGLQRARAPIPP